MSQSLPSYAAYKAAFKGRKMPFAYLDMDLFRQNIRDILPRAGAKRIRIASKSLRCRHALDELLSFDDKIQGLMTFSAEETVWLSQLGYDDLLLAYPIWHAEQVKAVCEEVGKGKSISLMVDSVAHIQHLGAVAKEMGVVLPVCLDLDLSLRIPGVHFGVFRSPVNSVETALAVHRAAKEQASLKLSGLMGYEAQVAGLGDRVPGMGIKAPVVRLLKKRSIKVVEERRKAVVEALRKDGAELTLVNGGGTGSMEFTREEEVVTEITAGSGFFASHLFDYYNNFKHLPSAGYAIEVVRGPGPGMYTCLGGGYVASGSLGIEKIPLPYLPEGAKLHPNEGAGEVQTPVVYKGKLELGDPVFMRHSKAGELCERFNELLLLEKGKVVGEAPTYRGEGKCFL